MLIAWSTTSSVRIIKVMGYNFNFACAIINLYTKHWAVSAEILASVFAELKHYATVFMVCSNSTTIGAGPEKKKNPSLSSFKLP